jgi:sporulation protein YlmC with PRC-barrel domain
MKDARIKNADGDDIGNLNRFVIDPKTRKITHIVFEQGTLLPKEYVLPMEWVDQVLDTEILLRPLPVSVDDYPPFEEENYVISEERDLLETEYIRADPGLRMHYYYPPMTYRPGGAPADAGRGIAPGSIGPRPGVRKEVQENIPEHTIALKEGAKVWSNDQKHVGDVEKVFVDPKNNKATHLLITKGFLSKERKLVPVDWVENIYEDRVNLAMRGDFMENLPEYQESA